MSLAINATTSSGIVLAADSRQSYRNQRGMARVGSDTASKLFSLNKRIGCAITGVAFLPSPGGIKNVSAFVEDFRRMEEVERLTVQEMAEKLHQFFETKYDWKKPLDEIKTLIKKDLESKGLELINDFEEKKGALIFRFKDKTGKEQQGVGEVDRIELMVAGFNDDGSHQVFICSVPGEVSKKRDSKEKGKEFGAAWTGQTDVTSRIVLGWDGRMFGLPFVRAAVQDKGEEQVKKNLGDLEYQISWGTMTLQDAIDFCVLSVRTTEAIQRFSDGIAMNPGDIPGVGGNIDVAIITRDKGFFWARKKDLVIEGKKSDTDRV